MSQFRSRGTTEIIQIVTSITGNCKSRLDSNASGILVRARDVYRQTTELSQLTSATAVRTGTISWNLVEHDFHGFLVEPLRRGKNHRDDVTRMRNG